MLAAITSPALGALDPVPVGRAKSVGSGMRGDACRSQRLTRACTNMDQLAPSCNPNAGVQEAKRIKNRKSHLKVVKKIAGFPPPFLAFPAGRLVKESPQDEEN